MICCPRKHCRQSDELKFTVHWLRKALPSQIFRGVLDNRVGHHGRHHYEPQCKLGSYAGRSNMGMATLNYVERKNDKTCSVYIHLYDILSKVACACRVSDADLIIKL
ncbi:hypothetical protein BaRGS_00028983 [Batillaria attramentaria]|uniref:Uncharacterized protein n=1 Tax=Batillaria attramentaria TaxID=370345 RepID=A0ABD0JZ33_9CAEN